MKALISLTGALLLACIGAVGLASMSNDSTWTALENTAPSIVLPTRIELPKRDYYGRALPTGDVILAVMPSCESCSKIPMTQAQIVERSPLPIVFAFPDKKLSAGSKKDHIVLTMETWKPPVEMWEVEGSLVRLDSSGRVKAVSSGTEYTSFLRRQSR